MRSFVAMIVMLIAICVNVAWAGNGTKYNINECNRYVPGSPSRIACEFEQFKICKKLADQASNKESHDIYTYFMRTHLLTACRMRDSDACEANEVIQNDLKNSQEYKKGAQINLNGTVWKNPIKEAGKIVFKFKENGQLVIDSGSISTGQWNKVGNNVNATSDGDELQCEITSKRMMSCTMKDRKNRMYNNWLLVFSK